MAARKKAVEPKPAEPIATLAENPDEAPVPGTDVGVLDNLIGTCYRQLIKENKANAKLGDLLKMIELRRKLTPSDSAQKEFWQMLEQIRKDTLPQKGATKVVNQLRVTRRKAHAA
ncbi:MAG: hypothetical protein WAU88_07725 [Candidatus Zixiibacteriota bacterium]